MTLNTQFLLPVHFELIGEISAFGVVTTDTGHHLAVPWVDNFRSNWMGKGPLTLMTTTADLVAITFEHGRGITAMSGMATGTVAALLVPGRLSLMSRVGVLMTAHADLPLGAGKQHTVITSMRAVTADTGIAVGVIGQVAMNQIIIPIHRLMTRETDTGWHRFIPLVTSLTAFLKWGMLHFPQQGFRITAVRTVTGQTAFDLHTE
jgi:hypothetical protein